MLWPTYILRLSPQHSPRSLYSVRTLCLTFKLPLCLFGARKWISSSEYRCRVCRTGWSLWYVVQPVVHLVQSEVSLIQLHGANSFLKCKAKFYLMTNLRHNSFLCMFISILYMFRAFRCSSSGDSVVSIRYLVYVTLCRWPSGMQVWMELCIPDGHLHRVTYTRYRIDTIESHDDEHLNSRNM
jgi:hypothetical protein